MEENTMQTGETHDGFAEGLSPDPAGQETGSGAETAPETTGQKSWTLRHMDEEKVVNEEEMTALAQKGMDYDRIRVKYDESKAVMTRLGRLSARAGVTAEEYLEGLGGDIGGAEADRRADIAEFHAAFPQAAGNPGSIAKEVWDEVRGGRSLVAAYARHALSEAIAEQERLRRELDTLRREGENARRSTGSLRSAGECGPRRDPFTAGWDS